MSTRSSRHSRLHLSNIILLICSVSNPNSFSNFFHLNELSSNRVCFLRSSFTHSTNVCKILHQLRAGHDWCLADNILQCLLGYLMLPMFSYTAHAHTSSRLCFVLVDWQVDRLTLVSDSTICICIALLYVTRWGSSSEILKMTPSLILVGVVTVEYCPLIKRDQFKKTNEKSKWDMYFIPRFGRVAAWGRTI